MTQTPKTWAAKDPMAVLDYIYTIPLDPGDSVSIYTLTVLSGDTTIDSDSLAAIPATNAEGVFGQDVTAWLSGGTETTLFAIAWTTTLSRQDDAIIVLPIVSADIVPLLLTGYAKPSPAHLAMKYPAFVDVPSSTVQFWLTDAERSVTNAWSEGDYAAGLMALAAHNMALAGLGTDGAALSGVPAGITAMKSGSLAINFTPEAANARLSGDFTASRYGQEYSMLLERNRGGPLVAPSGAPPYDVFPVGWPAGWP